MAPNNTVALAAYCPATTTLLQRSLEPRRMWDSYSAELFRFAQRALVLGYVFPLSYIMGSWRVRNDDNTAHTHTHTHAHGVPTSCVPRVSCPTPWRWCLLHATSTRDCSFSKRVSFASFDFDKDLVHARALPQAKVLIPRSQVLVLTDR